MRVRVRVRQSTCADLIRLVRTRQSLRKNASQPTPTLPYHLHISSTCLQYLVPHCSAYHRCTWAPISSFPWPHRFQVWRSHVSTGQRQQQFVRIATPGAVHHILVRTPFATAVGKARGEEGEEENKCLLHTLPNLASGQFQATFDLCQGIPLLLPRAIHPLARVRRLSCRY